MEKRFTLLISVLIVGILTANANLTISGPRTVCPSQEYTYNISTSFLFNNGNCGAARWDIYDENGNQLATGFGTTITYTFAHPQNETYTIEASASGGLGCWGSASDAITVTTRYPIPTVTGPTAMCAGNTRTFNANVNATFDCFHHAIDWQLPTGWSVATQNAGEYNVTVPSTAQNGSYTIRARVWYNNNLNTFGDWTSRTVWIGKPAQPSTDPPGYPTYNMTLGQIKTIRATSAAGATSYEWSVTGSIRLLSSANGSSITVEAYQTGIGNFNLRTRNSCGVSTLAGGNVNVSSSGGGDDPGGPVLMSLAISPNPVASTLKLEISNQDKSLTEKDNFIESNQRIFYEIYDINGQIKSKGVVHDLKSIDVSGWREGNYILNINQGGESESHHIYVKH